MKRRHAFALSRRGQVCVISRRGQSMALGSVLSRTLNSRLLRRYLREYLCYNRAIMLKQLTMRVLGAAIVLIVLSFAPSVAKAHIGHQHQASVHDGQSQLASQAASHESERPATSASLQQAQWEQAGMLAGFGPQLHRRLLLVRMRRLLRGRVAEPCGVRRRFLRSITRVAFVAVTDVAGPRARVAQAPSKTLHLNPRDH